jgi:hypothetical protein
MFERENHVYAPWQFAGRYNALKVSEALYTTASASSCSALCCSIHLP